MKRHPRVRRPDGRQRGGGMAGRAAHGARLRHALQDRRGNDRRGRSALAVTGVWVWLAGASSRAGSGPADRDAVHDARPQAG